MVSICPTLQPPASRISAQHGQATIEFVGVLPIVALCTLMVLQAFLLGLTLLFAQSAAVQMSRGAQTSPNLPAAWKRGARVRSSGEAVDVELRSPRVVPVGSLRISAHTHAVHSP